MAPEPASHPKGLTREEAEALRVERTEAFARLESLAATGTALLPTTEVTP